MLACVWRTNRNVSTIQNLNGAYTHSLIGKFGHSVPLNILDYLHLSLPVQATVLKTTPSIGLLFFTKIVLFYNGSELTLKY